MLPLDVRGLDEPAPASPAASTTDRPTPDSMARRARRSHGAVQYSARGKFFLDGEGVRLTCSNVICGLRVGACGGRRWGAAATANASALCALRRSTCDALDSDPCSTRPRQRCCAASQGARCARRAPPRPGCGVTAGAEGVDHRSPWGFQSSSPACAGALWPASDPLVFPTPCPTMRHPADPGRRQGVPCGLVGPRHGGVLHGDADACV